jgi:acetolactate synthase-1/2/3 large subunit
MHVGFEPAAFLQKADVVIVLDSPVPWIPRAHGPRPDAKIIHIAGDPLASRFPYREVEADLLVAGDPRAALAMLRQCLGEAVKTAKNGSMESRRKAIGIAREEIAARRQKLIETVKDQTPVHPAWLAHCLNQLKAENAIVISELGVPIAGLNLSQPRSFMGSLLSGGLGFGMGAALGAKLAAPEREVIVTVGDGSYMFGNPIPYHYVGRAESLPTLTIVANNHMWGAVRQATLDVFPDGAAAKANAMPITQLQPSPDFEKVIETCGGRGERVDAPGDLLPAMERSFAALRAGTPAMLNVITQGRR